MANSFIGELGRKYNRTDFGFICQDLQTCQDVWTDGIERGVNVIIDKFQDIFLVREQKIERILSDHTSINRFVISNSILQCLALLKENWTEHSELYSINTDGFYMTNPKYKYKMKAIMSNSMSKILASHLLQLANPIILKSIIVKIWIMIAIQIKLAKMERYIMARQDAVNQLNYVN